ncbi:MAG: hypothetical protein QNJ51_25740 [Calothrix sp. MO_167.B12]|nr:hypothetical protein [Calothrix sp. MO_167.B12]
MKSQIAIAVSFTGLVSFAAQSLFAIASGGFSVGSQISNINSELKLIRKDLAAQSQIYDYRLVQLEKSREK